jgi:hypothetical protein
MSVLLITRKIQENNLKPIFGILEDVASESKVEAAYIHCFHKY